MVVRSRADALREPIRSFSPVTSCSPLGDAFAGFITRPIGNPALASNRRPMWLKCAIESSSYSSPDQAGTSSRTSGRKMWGSCVRCRPSAHPRRGSFACTATAVALTGHRGRGRQSRAIASAGVTYVHRPPATRKEWSAPIARRLDSAVNTSAPVRIEVRRSLVRVRPPCIPAGATSSRSQRHCNGVSPWGWPGSASSPSSGSSRKNSPRADPLMAAMAIWVGPNPPRAAASKLLPARSRHTPSPAHLAGAGVWGAVRTSEPTVEAGRGLTKSL
jgi:hypothetical protein